MTSERIDKAVEIINYAIKNQISVKEASVQCGYADTYVKNVKAIVYEKYENGTLEDELFSKFDEAYKRYERGDLNYKPYLPKVEFNNKPIEIDCTGTAKLFGTGEKLNFNADDGKATIEWQSGDNYPPDHIKTLDELLTICEVDLDVWKVKNYVVNKWDVTAVIDKIPQTFQNFQVKAWLERKIEDIIEKNIGELFLDMIKNYEPPVLNLVTSNPLVKYNPTINNLLEICIFDLHMGKLAWGGETGENYDTKIARTRFLDALETLVNNASGFQYGRIVFPVGNDFFNSDTIYNTTTKGTPQDEDLRWQKTFNVGVKLLVDGINLLKQTGVPVDVIVIPGNHDFERSYYLGKYLEAWFNNDKQVTVNCGASPRKYYVFGQVLIGYTHGSEEKESSLPMLMATDIESKPFWSITTYHEYHVGHIHRKRDMKYTVLDKSRMTNEDLGVTIRYLSSLTGTEEWHHKKGFVGQIKAADAFVWNDKEGLIAILNANLKQ